jgi:hypothetical protein
MCPDGWPDMYSTDCSRPRRNLSVGEDTPWQLTKSLLLPKDLMPQLLTGQ